ncbi:hypothetical protein HanRHA438_Chr04g0188541 [Helianthus annuus]|nr:hypothetical protein HanRHA438_Chr04g0188541 [Helianthus annuus]
MISSINKGLLTEKIYKNISTRYNYLNSLENMCFVPSKQDLWVASSPSLVYYTCYKVRKISGYFYKQHKTFVTP